jgi:two-component system OmpR family response regulator
VSNLQTRAEEPRSEVDVIELRTVLLVDDQEDIRRIGELSLTEVGGLRVVVAGSGKDALLRVVEQKIDLILLDVTMPGLDGPATLAKLREDAAAQHIPVIFMTAKVQERELVHYRSLGVLGVIAKPFDPMTLADQIRKLACDAESEQA